MRAVVQFFVFYLFAALFFIIYNNLLDIVFYKIDYGSSKGVANGLGYVGYFLVLYSPLFLPFLALYNYAVKELLMKRDRWIRYGIALLIGLLIGLTIGRKGISFYIGSYRPVKNVFLFGLIMLSLELTRDVLLYLRTDQSDLK